MDSSDSESLISDIIRRGKHGSKRSPAVDKSQSSREHVFTFAACEQSQYASSLIISITLLVTSVFLNYCAE